MPNETIAMPAVTTRKEWLSQRLALLAQEKELTKQTDRINAARRRLPMVKVDKHYEFEGPDGKTTLLNLFAGREQLIVYHFMFDPAWENGCPGCTGFVKALGDLSTLSKRRTTFAVISRAPFAKLAAYKAKQGWTVDWYSSFNSEFNYDFHTTLDEQVAPVEYNYRTVAEFIARNAAHPKQGETPGVSVFFRSGSDVYHTYSTFARGVESLTDTYRLLDRTPYGRQESFEDSPQGWPQQPTYG